MLKLNFSLIALCVALNGVAQTTPRTPFSPSSEFSSRVLGSFQQAPASADIGLRGNCVSIALIKAAISTFGPDGVFRSNLHTHGLYTVVLRDGKTVTLTDEEDRLSESMSGFTLPYDDDEKKTVGDPDLMEKANFIWAVMTKMRAVEMDPEEPKLQDGINQLNGGDDARNVGRLLGLKEVKVHEGNEVSYIHANGYNAVFATGATWDDYGWPSPLERTLTGHNGLNPIKDLRHYDFKLLDY